MKNILFIILSLPLFSYSQTGPGGVGKSDGSSNLVLWLDANTIVGTNASIITTWPDQSGYGYDFTLGNGAVFNSPSVNGYPAFNFNGTNQYFERAYTADITPMEFTVFTSTKVSSSGSYKAVISNRDDPAGAATAGYILYSRPTSNNWTFWTGTPSGWALANSTSTAGSWSGQVLEYQDIPNGKKFYLDGATSVMNSQSMTSNPNRPCRVGAGRNESSPDYYFKGDIAEVIIFNQVLNSAERIIVNNYLSAKYNYSLSTNDIYNEDNAGNGDYDHDVAGIGRIDALNIHNDAQGTGIVRILNPSGLDDDEFLIWGHDNGVQQATEKIDIPPTVQARFERIWRVSEVNTALSAVDVGNIDIRFDLTNLGSVVATDLRLLVDTDNDGIFADETPISGATLISGNIYQFSNITDIANNLRFTLATINDFQTPLPIELISFTATVFKDENIILNWITASEINNDYFTVEKSKNGINWIFVDKVNGEGTSSSIINYQSFDENPFKGTSYYRLKQTNFDGEYEYSKIEAVNTDEFSRSQIKIYPNPAKDEITIEGSKLELHNFKIYNILGQDVTKYISIIENNNNKIKIDLSQLNNGIYFIKTKTNVNKVHKQ